MFGSTLHQANHKALSTKYWVLFDEAIAEPMNSNNVLRRGRVLFDFLPQSGDMVINRARDRRAVVAPNFVEQLISRYDFTSMPYQVVQDLKFARGKI